MTVWGATARPAGQLRHALSQWAAGASATSRQGALVIADLLLVGIGVIVGSSAQSILLVPSAHAEVLPVQLCFALPFLWVGALAASGVYSTALLRTGVTELQRVTLASLLLAGIIAVICFLLDIHLSRGFFVAFFLTGIPVLILARLARRWVINRMCERGAIRLPVLLAGSPAHVDDVARVLRREKWLGYHIVGVLTPEPLRETPLGLPVVGVVDDVAELIGQAEHLHAVIFAEGSFTDSRHFKRTTWDMEEHRAHMIVAPALTDVSADRLAARPVAGLPLLHVGRTHAERAGRWNKRVFDIVGSGILLLFALPVMAVAALAIKLEDGGPVFFKQTRVGRRGKEFTCHKIRSMVIDAESRKAELQSQNEGAGVLFKMARDPRVTRAGQVIRRFSIDELPQLWNAFRGDMSLVGPRPALPSEVARYDPDDTRRLDVRPGLTGLWQVSGRSNLSWDESIRLDTYYVDNWSMMQDLTILFRTAKAVLSSRGAY